MRPDRPNDATKVAKPLIHVPPCKHASERPFPDNFGSTVKVEVGKGSHKASFVVYEGLLSHYSSYFRAALKPEWDPARSRTIKLAEEEPTVFQEFFNWLYTGRIYTKLTPTGKIPLKSVEICSIHAFGDARGIPELCNAAIDLLFQLCDCEPAFPTNCVNYIYANTPKGSYLRAIITDLAIRVFKFSTMSNRAHDFPKEFSIDVISRSCASRVSLSDDNISDGFWEDFALDICTYHDHSDPHQAR